MSIYLHIYLYICGGHTGGLAYRAKPFTVILKIRQLYCDLISHYFLAALMCLMNGNCRNIDIFIYTVNKLTHIYTY
jgi:hypothetical protein